MPSRKPIVWVIKEQVKRGVTGPEPMDYTAAMKYGDIRFITHFDLPLHPGGSLTNEWWKDVQEFMSEYTEDRDFIVATGQPLAMVMIGHILGRGEVSPQFLVWRREDNKYIPLRIVIPEFVK